MLASALPARWGAAQRCRNAALYALVWVLAQAVRRIPLRIGRHLATVLGVLCDRLLGHERRLALRHLTLALPGLSAAERRHIVRRMFAHLALCAIEVARIAELLRTPGAAALSPSARGVLDAALAEGKGVVVVSGHIGNWELLAQVVAAAGYPITTIARPLYDPRLTRLIDRERGRYGLRVLWRGDTGSAKKILRVFRDRGILAMLIDQDTRVQGTFVPFFGRPAYTPSAAAALALRTGAPIVVVWTHRRGTRHECQMERLPVPALPRARAAAAEATDDREEAVRALTAAATGKLEAAIRAHPEQWVWMHRRWRRQPPASNPELDNAQ